MNRLIALALIAATLLIAGCETVRGLGKDVEKAGTWIQQKAN